MSTTVHKGKIAKYENVKGGVKGSAVLNGIGNPNSYFPQR